MERQVYTYFYLIGDIGGFNAAVVLFPAYLMHFYSQQMFKSQILKEMPSNSKIKGKRRRSFLFQKL